MADLDRLKHEWQVESARLKEVEDRVSQAWTDFASGNGPAPSADLMLALAAARRESDARLQVLLASMTIGPKPTPDPTPGPTSGPSSGNRGQPGTAG